MTGEPAVTAGLWLDEAAVARATDAVVAALRARGCTAGDRVAVHAGNGGAFVAARDAATRLGLVLAPINPRLAREEIAWIVAHARPRAILAEAGLATGLAAIVRDPDRVLAVDEIEGAGAPSAVAPPGDGVGATLLYTSGTTGTPKGCLRTEAQEAARVAELIASYGLGAGDVHLITCPLAHSAPGIFLRAGRAVGARTAIAPRFTAESFVAAVTATRATVSFLVPTQLERLLALPPEARPPEAIVSLRAVIVAGAPFPPRLKQRAVEWLGPGRLWEFYGSSETGTISVLAPDDQLARAGSVGRPPPGVDVRIVDGEIYVSSPSVMAGYLDDDLRLVPRDAYVSVGDLGHLDDDGYLHLVDRKHDTIISGGLNVYPAEVERALSAHPDILGAVVTGVPDDEWGQLVAALIAPRPGSDLAALGEDALVDALRAFLADRLARYKHPRRVRAVAAAELPVGSSGKPQRRAARALLVLRRSDLER